MLLLPRSPRIKSRPRSRGGRARSGNVRLRRTAPTMLHRRERTPRSLVAPSAFLPFLFFFPLFPSPRSLPRCAFRSLSRSSTGPRARQNVVDRRAGAGVHSRCGILSVCFRRRLARPCVIHRSTAASLRVRRRLVGDPATPLARVASSRVLRGMQQTASKPANRVCGARGDANVRPRTRAASEIDHPRTRGARGTPGKKGRGTTRHGARAASAAETTAAHIERLKNAQRVSTRKMHRDTRTHSSPLCTRPLGDAARAPPRGISPTGLTPPPPSLPARWRAREGGERAVPARAMGAPTTSPTTHRPRPYMPGPRARTPQ